MNLKLIDGAIRAAEATAEPADLARLSFFRILWGEQNECSHELVDAALYKAPAADELRELYEAGTPILTEHPVGIDPALLASTSKRLADVFVASGQFPAALCEALGSFEWGRAISGSNIALAGSAPAAWLENMAEMFDWEAADDLVGAGADEVAAEVADQAARLVLHILALALKVQLEDAGAAVDRAIKKAELGKPRPLVCPACGTQPHLAHVGGKTSSSGRGRMLVCPQCSCTWEFERVRCARCGHQNQGHLHFFNVEGDDAHRIATCDECGGYIRTLYSENVLAGACAYEVEDILMTRLDAIAANPQVAAGPSAQ